MITVQAIHEDFVRKLNRDIIKFTKYLETQNETKKYIEKSIEEQVGFLEIHCPHYKKVYKAYNGRGIGQLRWSGYEDATKKRYFIILANQLVKVNSNIRGTIKNIELFNKYLSVHKEMFIDIIEQFNTSIVQKMIETGYVFKPGMDIGNIAVLVKRASGRRVLWPETNAKKEEILKRGGTLYNDKTNPEGEKYISYDTKEYSPYWHWHKKSCCITNKEHYLMKMIQGPGASERALYNYLEKNPHVIHRYGTFDRITKAL